MSEQLPNGEYPFAHFTFQGERFPMTPRNTSVYTYLGRLAMYDHVLVQPTPNLDKYFWRENYDFEEMVRRAEAVGCDVNPRLTEVDEATVDAYRNRPGV
ncbi:hypothetical protein [uncultured Kocuria sp.]|uniref:hypothetical protein n=1 Tax=uncultured Kocuria sp. TaxID=259305 RepID=UPI002621BD0A|nr:hypothetical protein [uncultured Kocuria sp.]